MSDDVRRYKYVLESCGRCEAEFVLACHYDALQARVAKLEAALRKIVWMTEHEHEMRGLDDAWEIARDALATAVNQGEQREA